MARSIGPELHACRVALELKPGQVVSLGPGIPTMIPAYIPTVSGVVFHAENGVLRYGPKADRGTEDLDLVGAGGSHITLLPGGTVVSQADSFGMLRGGHIDVAIVEAHQVSEKGDLVGPMSAESGLGGHGASVDIAAGAKLTIAMMPHVTLSGAHRIVSELGVPPVGRRCVDLIMTDVAVIEVTDEGLVLKEVALGWTVEEVQANTGAPLIRAEELQIIQFAIRAGETPSKIFANGAEAVADVPDGAVVLLDGFAGPGGMAQYLITSLRDQGAQDLTMVSNTAGIASVVAFGTPPGFVAIDHSLLVDNGQIKKAVASYPVSPSPSHASAFELAYKRGEAELELVPQGTLAERIRAGGYGIAAFYTPTAAGTPIADGKSTRMIDGREQVLEHAIKGDYALIRAHKADKAGNLVYKGTSRNFNAVMAPSATVTIAEVDEIVEIGELDPDAIVTPGIFVQRIVQRPADFQPYTPA